MRMPAGGSWRGFPFGPPIEVPFCSLFSLCQRFQRTWDVLKEDEEGSLVSTVNNLQQQAKRRRLSLCLPFSRHGLPNPQNP